MACRREDSVYTPNSRVNLYVTIVRYTGVVFFSNHLAKEHRKKARRILCREWQEIYGLDRARVFWCDGVCGLCRCCGWEVDVFEIFVATFTRDWG